jgi:hypothetical protein
VGVEGDAVDDRGDQSRVGQHGSPFAAREIAGQRTVSLPALITAMNAAVDTGPVDPQVVLIEARRHSTTGGNGHDTTLPIGAWSRYDRPAPTLAGYDALLSGTQGGTR